MGADGTTWTGLDRHMEPDSVSADASHLTEITPKDTSKALNKKGTFYVYLKPEITHLLVGQIPDAATRTDSLETFPFYPNSSTETLLCTD